MESIGGDCASERASIFKAQKPKPTDILHLPIEGHFPGGLFCRFEQHTNRLALAEWHGAICVVLHQEEDSSQGDRSLNVPAAARVPSHKLAQCGPGVRPVAFLWMVNDQHRVIAESLPRGRKPLACSGLARASGASQDHATPSRLHKCSVDQEGSFRLDLKEDGEAQPHELVADLTRLVAEAVGDDLPAEACIGAGLRLSGRIKGVFSDLKGPARKDHLLQGSRFELAYLARIR